MSDHCSLSSSTTGGARSAAPAGRGWRIWRGCAIGLAALVGIAVGAAPGAAVVLDNGALRVDVRNDNGAYFSIKLNGADYFRWGTYVSNWGMQVGTDTSSFRTNDAYGATGIPVTVTAGVDSVSVAGVYSAGGATVAVERILRLVPGRNALRIETRLRNDGAGTVTVRVFETFDPDQGISFGLGYWTTDDVYALAGATLARATASNGYTVILRGLTPGAVLAAGGPFGIFYGSDLNGFFSSPVDGNGSGNDSGSHIGYALALAPGETKIIEHLQAYGAAQAAAEAAAVSECGNGVVEVEGCDDGGLVDGDGCSASCSVEPGFACSGAPSACAPVCSDGLIAGGEGCDDGNTDPGDGCGAACAVESGYGCAGTPSACAAVCGDGLVVGGEGCDDGGVAGGDGCSATCTQEAGYSCSGAPSVCVATCGDGIPAGAEECDDGNLIDDDGCSASCDVEATFSCSGTPSVCATDCGNGVVDGGEQCDDGARVDGDGCAKVCTEEPGWSCSGAPSVCGEVCGDGAIVGGEQCDDGNALAGDCCSAACAFEPSGLACFVSAEVVSFGSSYAGPFQPVTAGWEFALRADVTVTSLAVYDCADDGLADSHQVGIWDKDAGPLLLASAVVPSGTGAPLVDHFRHVAIPPLALVAGRSYVVAALYPAGGGDCVVTGGTFNYDPRLGFVTGREIFTPAGFSYPSGLVGSRFGATFTFESLRGDGVVDGGEQCDDGNVASGDGCSANGVIESGYACSGAPSLCATVCGDSLIAGSETCDDGDVDAGDGCSATCAIEGTFTCRGLPSVCTDTCGDGVVDGGEFCDDGNLAAGDGCTPQCTVEPSYECTGSPSVCTTDCGDGILDPQEQCDDGNLIAGDCCSRFCQFEPTNVPCHQSMPVPSGSGNSGGVGVVEGWEFSVSAPVTIAALGVYDEPSSAGLGEEHPIGIWDSTQQLLATAIVPAGSGGTLVNGFRYVPIAGLDLVPGQNYVIGAYYPPPRNDTVIDAPMPTLDPRLTLVGGRRLPFVGGLVFPSSTSTNSRVGPGFLLALTGCGNGAPDGSEACDDGNLADGDCCSSACEIFAGTCSDDDVCTTTDTCQAGACVGSNPLDCDDDNGCTADSCNPASGCLNDAAPAIGCLGAGKGLLLVKNAGDDAKDQLLWKWGNGDAVTLANLADPLASASYSLCVYGGGSTLIGAADLPPGSGWATVGSSGFKFKGTSPDGLTKALLKAGVAGKSKALIKGKGTALPDPVLPLTTPVRVQLRKDTSALCLESTFSPGDVLRNDGQQFKAKH